MTENQNIDLIKWRWQAKSVSPWEEVLVGLLFVPRQTFTKSDFLRDE